MSQQRDKLGRFVKRRRHVVSGPRSVVPRDRPASGWGTPRSQQSPFDRERSTMKALDLTGQAIRVDHG